MSECGEFEYQRKPSTQCRCSAQAQAQALSFADTGPAKTRTARARVRIFQRDNQIIRPVAVYEFGDFGVILSFAHDLHVRLVTNRCSDQFPHKAWTVCDNHSDLVHDRLPAASMQRRGATDKVQRWAVLLPVPEVLLNRGGSTARAVTKRARWDATCIPSCSLSNDWVNEAMSADQMGGCCGYSGWSRRW